MEASKLSRTAIQEYAEMVGEHYKLFESGYHGDVHDLVHRLGGNVDISDTLFADEALTVRSIGDFTIHLPPLTSERRDRFTIAHELGHYFLHYLEPRIQGPRRFGRGQRNATETQANYFAASLLMPEAKFKEAFIRFAGDDWLIADAFGVSPRAADVRAQTLGLR